MSNNAKLLLIFFFLIILSGVSIWYSSNLSQGDIFIPTPFPTEILSSPTIKSQLPATKSGALGIEGEKAMVTKVIDGDTAEVLTGGQKFTVRFLGIDTPETVDPRRPVGCFGKEASNKTKELLSGKEVILQKDISNTDKYNRLLRFIYLPLENGSYLFVNDYLIRAGYAYAITYPPDVKYSEKFRQAEKEAKEERRGLWERC